MTPPAGQDSLMTRFGPPSLTSTALLPHGTVTLLPVVTLVVYTVYSLLHCCYIFVAVVLFFIRTHTHAVDYPDRLHGDLEKRAPRSPVLARASPSGIRAERLGGDYFARDMCLAHAAHLQLNDPGIGRQPHATG
jgi:hypothetical protein